MLKKKNPSEMFFISVIEKINETSYGIPDLGDCRCWGYFDNFDEAERVVVNNETDINEGIYNYAVIELLGPGISSPCFNESRVFYKFNYTSGRYEEIVEPESVVHLCNFSIG